LWQLNNLKADRLGKEIKRGTGKDRLSMYLAKPTGYGNICNKIRERCNDVERQNIFSEVNVKVSLSFYCEMKQEWGKDSYIEKCTRKERIEVIWWKAEIWKLRGIRRGFEMGRWPLCLGEEDAKL
jgi:hypothetical protein